MFSRANGLIVLYTYIYCLASTLIFSFFIHLAKLDIRSLSFDSKEEEILVLILISPLIEVYFFQKLIIDFLVNKKINWFIDIIVSSLLFGIAHSSTPIQFAKGFINGYFYANGYLKLKKNSSYPFTGIFIAHALHNLTVFMISEIGRNL